jgi:hypothetical protein
MGIPGEDAGEGGPDTAAAGRSTDAEVVPTPKEQPRVINLPPPPQEPTPEVNKPDVPSPQKDLPIAPLPDDIKAPRDESTQTREPHALRWAKSVAAAARTDNPSPQSNDDEDGWVWVDSRS